MTLCVDKSSIQAVTEDGVDGYRLPPDFIRGAGFDFRSKEELETPNQTPTRGILVETDSPGDYEFTLGNWDTPLNAARKTAIERATGKAVAVDAGTVGEAILDFFFLHAQTDGSTAKPCGFNRHNALCLPPWKSLRPRLRNMRPARRVAYIAAARQKQRVIMWQDVLATYQSGAAATARKQLAACGLKLGLDWRDPLHRRMIKQAIVPQNLWDDVSLDPADPETVVSDDFGDASYSGWTTTNGSAPTETGGYLESSNTSEFEGRFDSDLSTDDMLCHVDFASFSANSADLCYLGACTRYASAARTCYQARHQKVAGGTVTSLRMVRFNGGVFHDFGSIGGASALSAGGVWCTADASIVTGYIDDDLTKIEVYDSALTGQTRVGIVMRASSVSSAVRAESIQGEDWVTPSVGGGMLVHPGMSGGFRG